MFDDLLDEVAPTKSDARTPAGGSQAGMFDQELQDELNALRERIDKRDRARRERSEARANGVRSRAIQAIKSLPDDHPQRPLVDRAAAAVDSLLGGGHPAATEMAWIIAAGFMGDLKRPSGLTEETVSHRESLARKTLADIAKGGVVSPVAWRPVTRDLMAELDPELSKLPLPIRDQLVDVWNEQGKKLGKLGYASMAEVDSSSPRQALEIKGVMQSAWASAVILSGARERVAKGYKNANLAKLERMENEATRDLGIDTRQYPGVNTVPESMKAAPGDVPLLTAPTREDVLRQQKHKEKADELDRKEQIRKESEAGAGSFGLEAQDGRQDTTGGLFDAPVASDRIGDFVRAPDGSIDFGEITPELGRAMRRQAGKIRLTEGVQNADGTGHGLAHIEANHGDQIRAAGFESVPAFVGHVARSFNEILQAAKGKQLLVAVTDGRRDVMFIQLDSEEGSDFYRVNTAFPASRNYLEKQEVGCCRFQRHLVKVEDGTGGGLWREEGHSVGSSSSRR